MKNKEEYVEIIAVAGSLVICPDKIKKTFRKLFNAGVRCCETHPDDNTYDTIHFNSAFGRVMKSFSENDKKKNKYRKGGTKMKH